MDVREIRAYLTQRNINFIYYYAHNNLNVAPGTRPHVHIYHYTARPDWKPYFNTQILYVKI